MEEKHDVLRKGWPKKDWMDGVTVSIVRCSRFGPIGLAPIAHCSLSLFEEIDNCAPTIIMK